MATGGKSYPKLGTDGGGWRVLKGLGHSLRNPYPALTPLKGSHPSGAQLSGENRVMMLAEGSAGRPTMGVFRACSRLWRHSCTACTAVELPDGILSARPLHPMLASHMTCFIEDGNVVGCLLQG